MLKTDAINMGSCVVPLNPKIIVLFKRSASSLSRTRLYTRPLIRALQLAWRQYAIFVRISPVEQRPREREMFVKIGVGAAIRPVL